jgi:hypothetical protein
MRSQKRLDPITHFPVIAADPVQVRSAFPEWQSESFGKDLHITTGELVHKMTRPIQSTSLRLGFYSKHRC